MIKFSWASILFPFINTRVVDSLIIVNDLELFHTGYEFYRSLLTDDVFCLIVLIKLLWLIGCLDNLMIIGHTRFFGRFCGAKAQWRYTSFWWKNSAEFLGGIYVYLLAIPVFLPSVTRIGEPSNFCSYLAYILKNSLNIYNYYIVNP